jgi:hypothetical protein
VERVNFDGLCFPVAKVKFLGATDRSGARWSASIRRSNELTYRAIVSYDDALPDGARNAVTAAWKCYAKAQAWMDDYNPDDYVAIPGDLSAREYSFTFVPREYLN